MTHDRQVLGRHDRLADASRSEDQRARPGREPAAEQRVECRDATFDGLQLRPARLVGSHHVGKHAKAARSDADVVKPAAEIHAA
jgi:hypothetical protein